MALEQRGSTVITFSHVTKDKALALAYDYCYKIARTHYENFPVASRFIPKKLRTAITVIYAFARTADDIADEGNLEPEQRLKILNRYRQYINQKGDHCYPQGNDLIFSALQDVIKSHHLPLPLFLDLLSAFEQDVIKKEYDNFSGIVDYCKKSACPIGRLVLHLTLNASEQNFYYSDCICTALQLIDFLQDLSSDLLIRDRCYLAQDELKNHGLSKEFLRTAALSYQEDPNMTTPQTIALQSLVSQQLNHIENLLHQGKPLARVLTGRFGFEFRLVLASAHKMLEKLKIRPSIFTRPSIKRFEWPLLILQALRPGKKSL